MSGSHLTRTSLEPTGVNAASAALETASRDAELLGVMAAMVSRYLAAMGGWDDDIARAVL